MDNLGFAGKERAAFIGVTANHDYIVELNTRQLVQKFGTVTGNIHSRFGHDLYRIRILSVSLDSGGISLDDVVFYASAPAFGHLTAA